MKPTRFLGILSLVVFALPSLVFSQGLPSGESLEKTGKLKDAAEAYITEAFAATGEKAQVLIRKAADVDPDTKHLGTILTRLARDHGDTLARSTAYYELGTLQLLERNYLQARNSFTSAYKAASQHWEARYRALSLGLYIGAYDTVRGELDEAFRANPPGAWFSKFALISALWLGHDNRHSQALNLLDEQILSKPDPGPEAYAVAILLAGKLNLSERQALLRKDLQSRYPKDYLTKTILDSENLELDPIFLIIGARLELPSTATLEDKPRGDTMVQLGSFSKEENARAFLDKLTKEVPSAQGIIIAAKGSFRILSPLPTGTDPDDYLVSLKEKGFEGFLTND